MSIRRKMAKGVFWLFLEKGSQQLSSIVVFIVIARLIGPEEYGLVALCAVFLSLAINLINSLVDPVISLHIKDDLRLSTLFWMVNFCGLGLSLFSYSVAGPFAELLGHARIAPLLQSFSVLPILLALASVPTALVTASMDFRIFVVRTLFATLVGGVIGIAMATRGYGAFALAGQQIGLYIVINLVVWPGCGWRPRLLFKAGAMSDIVRLGLNQAGSSFVSFFEEQMPRLLLGYALGPTAVGQYAFVTRICSALQDVLIQPVLSVIYPAFAQIRDEREEQKRILSQLVALIGALILPAIAGAIMTAPLYVPLLFGRTWEPAVPVLQLYFLTQLPLAIAVILRDFLRARKQIAHYLRLQFVLVLCVILLASILVRYGISAFILGIILMAFIAVIAYTGLVARRTRISLWGDYARLWAPVAASAVMCAALAGFAESPLHPSSPMKLLLSEMALGMLVYMAVYGLLRFRQIGQTLSLIKKMRARNPEISLAVKEPLAQDGI